jgi:hypothetical protein
MSACADCVVAMASAPMMTRAKAVGRRLRRRSDVEYCAGFVMMVSLLNATVDGCRFRRGKCTPLSCGLPTERDITGENRLIATNPGKKRRRALFTFRQT